MERSIDFGKDAANPSGAPDAGGATTLGSHFGGDTWSAHALRALARWSRAIEAECYRRLRDRELRESDGTFRPGAPNRVRMAGRLFDGRIH
jgi:hypothetical protein